MRSIPVRVLREGPKFHTTPKNADMLTFDTESSDEEITTALRRIKEGDPASEEVAIELAEKYVNSGEIFSPPSGSITADVASTGGPSSLTTLLIPLFLSASGLYVPKLGVPGRPAGGIDCLAQIEGYKTELDARELRAAMEYAGYAHFEANGLFAPLDARAFRLRQQVAAQDVPTLVVASLLSKKMAVGVQRAGLDIRVAPHGNFGKTWESAKSNARLFTAVASRLGLSGHPVLTDGRYPYQPYIGRAESLLALEDTFTGNACAWLCAHVEQCRQIAISVAPENKRSTVTSVKAHELKSAFLRNLEAQGANEVSFNQLVSATRAQHIHRLVADRDGFVRYSLNGIRESFVRYQANTVAAAKFSDPVGIMLQRRHGEWVGQGQCIASLRVSGELNAEHVVATLQQHIGKTSEHLTTISMEGV